MFLQIIEQIRRGIGLGQLPFLRLKKFFDANGAAYPVWQALEAEAGRYLQ